mgnify:CR=1 FL=1
MATESTNLPAGRSTRRLDPLDTDLLGRLDALDQRLYALIHHASKYRAIILTDLRLLRQGADPGQVRAGLERWTLVLKEIRRLAREL